MKEYGRNHPSSSSLCFLLSVLSPLCCRANDDLSVLIDDINNKTSNWTAASDFNNNNIYSWWDLTAIANQAGLLTQGDLRKADVTARAKAIVALAAKIKATYTSSLPSLAKQKLPANLLKNMTSAIQRLTSAVDKLAENGGLAAYVEPVKPKFRGGSSGRGQLSGGRHTRGALQ